MREAVDLAQNRPELRDELGSLLAEQNDYALAEGEFRAALKLNPQYEHAMLHLGVALLKLEKQPEAKAALQLAVQTNPQDGVAHFYLGNVLESEQEQHAAYD